MSVPYLPPKPYVVHVHLASDRPELGFEIRETTGRLLCAEPCDEPLEVKEYQRFRIAPARASAGVSLIFDEIPPFALPPDQPRLNLTVHSEHPERRLGGAFTLGGGAAVGGLGLLTGIVAASWLGIHQPQDPGTTREVRNTGFVIAGAGALVALIGAIILRSSPPPHATLEP